MSKARRIRRQQERTAAKHLSMLGELLGRFYTFLEKTPQPSDDEVRSEFIRHEQTWKLYCYQNHLNPRASMLFNQEVAQSWKNRYAKQDSQTQN